MVFRSSQFEANAEASSGHALRGWPGTGGSQPGVHPDPAGVAVRPGVGQTALGLHHGSPLPQGLFDHGALRLPLGRGGSRQRDHL